MLLEFTGWFIVVVILISMIIGINCLVRRAYTDDFGIEYKDKPRGGLNKNEETS